MLNKSYGFVVGIRMSRVENLVAVHHRHEVLRVAEVDNVVRVAGQHVDALDVVATDFKLDDFVRAELAFLDEAVA